MDWKPTDEGMKVYNELSFDRLRNLTHNAYGKGFFLRVGLSLEEAADVVDRFSPHSHIPEPIRTAHLIAGALVDGVSRGDP